MPSITRSFPRRGASGIMPILILVIGVVMLAVGIAIGMSMGKRDAEPQTAGSTGTVTRTASNNNNVPNFNAGDSIDPDLEARMDAARVAAAHPGDFEDEAGAAHDEHEVDLGGPPPPVVFEPAELDFGTVKPGRHYTGTVHIRNTGTEPLYIEASRASCTCTAVDMSDTWIQPGESVPMDATFTQTSLGDKKAAVRVKFRNYDAIAELPIKALVALPVVAEPAYVQASTERDANEAVTSGEIVIRSLDEQPFHILTIDGMPPVFKDYDPKADSARNSYTILWDISDIDPLRCVDKQGKPLRRYWVVETDHPDCPVFDLQIRHRCTLPEPRGRRNWIVSPPRILLGEMKPGESVELECSLKWVPKADHNEKVHAVMPESPYLDIELLNFIPGTKEDRFFIKVTIKDNAPEGMLYETARVHSQYNKAPLLMTGRISKK